MPRFASAVLYPQNAVERATLLTDQHRFSLAITNRSGRKVLQGADHPLLATTFRSERSYEKRHHKPSRFRRKEYAENRPIRGRRSRIGTYGRLEPARARKRCESLAPLRPELQSGSALGL